MKFLIYVLAGIILAVAVTGLFYHTFWLALEMAFDVNAIPNNAIISIGCLVLGIISALVFDKCED
jgi:hypothetical protein